MVALEAAVAAGTLGPISCQENCLATPNVFESCYWGTYGSAPEVFKVSGSAESDRNMAKVFFFLGLGRGLSRMDIAMPPFERLRWERWWARMRVSSIAAA